MTTWSFSAERGESPGEALLRAVHSAIDPRLHGAMAQAAEVQGASLNALIEEMLERTFGTFKPKGRIGSANKPATRPTKKRTTQSRRTTVQKSMTSAAFTMQEPGVSKESKVPKSNKTGKG